ncbi:MAG: ABC transporter permease, partial [Propionibacteriaceae bacterium]|nr:ABC transporter permease [Propionibacteriaceae bacterium]
MTAPSAAPPRPPSRFKAALAKMAAGSVLTSVLAVVVALAVGGLLIIAADADVQRAAAYLFARPGDFFAAAWEAVASAYAALFQGAVVNVSTARAAGQVFAPLWDTVAMGVPLIFAGLGLGIGFRAGLFNIGAQGQIVLGAILCGYIGFAWHLPAGLHVVACLAGAVVGGAVWGFIPGLLKAKTGANEVIVTIMLNSIAGFFLGWLLTLSAFRRPGSNNPVSPAVDVTARLPAFFGTPVNLGFLLAVAAAVAVWWLMERSTLGFRIRAVGANQDAARTAGMSVAAATVWVMVISGALAGLAATSQLLSSPEQQLNAGIAGTFGF